MSTNNMINATGPLTDGQIYIGSSIGPAVAANITMTGGTVTNGHNTIAISVTGGGLTWSTITASTLSAQVAHGYVLNHASTACVITLPSTCAVGDKISLRGLSGSGGWTATANTGQTIQFGNTSSSSAGSWSSTNAGDGCDLECIVTNTTWNLSNCVSSGLTVV